MVVLMVAVFAFQLYDVQVKQAAAVSTKPSNSFTYYTRVKAARGEILDRNGNVLVGNRASFNLVLVRDVIYSADTPNEDLRRLTNLCAELGLEYTDHFPVSAEKPYEYNDYRYSGTWSTYYKAFLLARDWDSDISAPQLVRRLRDRYHIPDDWTEEEARRVIAVRYELDLRTCTNLPTYVLLEDVDSASLAALTDLNVPGLNVETSTVREYHTTYAAHILGRTGPMNAEEYEKYKEQGYEMDATVGKDGLELAFEAELHGTDGLRETTISADGTVLSERYIVEPIAGNNVELTIDINYQRLAEEELEKLILELHEKGVGSFQSGKDAEGGAVVVEKVKTGEILVSASYPTFDLSTYSENFNELKDAEGAPLYNRALLATYPPGSAFKMVTTIAAIESGIINRNTTIYDKGIYMRFEDSDYTPRCMYYTTTNGRLTHGNINVMQALAVSCNYYFYEIGYLTGIAEIDRVAKGLGLGEKTGVEVYEASGYRANPETKSELYSDGSWYGGDTIAAAIGQSDNLFTPIQLCSYTATLANRGTRYSTTFLRRVISADYKTLLQQNEPEILSTLAISDESFAAYNEGMFMTTTEYLGTSVSLFGNYDIEVCTKSGTASHGSGGSDNASFVLYAPKDDPEIAISIYVEKGGQGGNLGKIAKAILEAYYSESGSVDTVPSENTVG